MNGHNAINKRECHVTNQLAKEGAEITVSWTSNPASYTLIYASVTHPCDKIGMVWTMIQIMKKQTFVHLRIYQTLFSSSAGIKGPKCRQIMQEVLEILSLSFSNFKTT